MECQEGGGKWANGKSIQNWKFAKSDSVFEMRSRSELFLMTPVYFDCFFSVILLKESKYHFFIYNSS